MHDPATCAYITDMTLAMGQKLAALQVVRLVDALESRVVSSSSSTALYAKLRSLGEKLDLLEAQLAPTNVKGLRHAVDALTAAVDLQVRRMLQSQALLWAS